MCQSCSIIKMIREFDLHNIGLRITLDMCNRRMMALATVSIITTYDTRIRVTTCFGPCLLDYAKVDTFFLQKYKKNHKKNVGNIQKKLYISKGSAEHKPKGECFFLHNVACVAMGGYSQRVHYLKFLGICTHRNQASNQPTHKSQAYASSMARNKENVLVGSTCSLRVTSSGCTGAAWVQLVSCT